MTSVPCLLFMHGGRATEPRPLIDDATRYLAAALADPRTKRGVLRPSGRFDAAATPAGGATACVCGAWVPKGERQLPEGTVVPAAAVHYLAWHRGQVSFDDLAAVLQLDCGEAEPTREQLCNPPGSRPPVISTPSL